MKRKAACRLPMFSLNEYSESSCCMAGVTVTWVSPPCPWLSVRSKQEQIFLATFNEDGMLCFQLRNSQCCLRAVCNFLSSDPSPFPRSCSSWTTWGAICPSSSSLSQELAASSIPLVSGSKTSSRSEKKANFCLQRHNEQTQKRI